MTPVCLRPIFLKTVIGTNSVTVEHLLVVATVVANGHVPDDIMCKYLENVERQSLGFKSPSVGNGIMQIKCSSD